MKIPSKLQNLLSEESAIMASVLASLVEFEPWVKDSYLPFFPEYTDHGIKHIEDVLNAAEFLIRDEAWEVLTPADAATILLATLLHDSAMHLTPDSFIALIDDQNTKYCIPELDKKNWRQLWDDFLSEALRFDGRQLVALFGNSEPVTVPPLDPDNMSVRDNKLIGEFIRRHHHRLAHEIALFGVPSPGNNKIRLANGLPEYMTDLTGLVARSHGLSIRSCIPYLEDRYALREYNQIHAIFLMALLRTADYLQIEPQRAPKQILKVTQLRSSISRGEWDFHHAIKAIEYHVDPESLIVVACPKDVKTFLKIKNLLADFQVELDTAWAVLGEIYGRFSDEKLDLLGLKLRRIRSNFDDLEKFSKKIKYIPIHTAFTTADPSVLNLLVRPLYNNNCAFGIRELIQNAVDAVLELREFQKNHPEYKSLPLTPKKSDVVVSIKKGRKAKSLWLTVTDLGIGMNSKIICDYFLRAGVSFRESDVWRKEFVDFQGKSRVARSGRFGIGVLACFLIGPEITVSTRRAGTNPNEGIEFTASLYTSTIQLNRISREVGTEIRIRIFDDLSQKYNSEKWRSAMEWYYLSDPSVELEIKGKKVKPKYSLPNPTPQPLPSNWRSTKHPDYEYIIWSYVDAPALTCNGLRVVESKPKDSVPLSTKYSIAGSIRIPNISVFDYDGNLPLNLQRTQLAQDVPFEQELLEDVLRDFLSFVLVYSPHTSLADTSTWDFYQHVAYQGIDIPIRQLAPWFCTDQGVSFIDRWHVSQVLDKSAVTFFMDSQNELLQHVLSVGPMSIIGLEWPPIHRYFDDSYSPKAILYSLLLREPDPELQRIPSTVGVRILLSIGFLSLLKGVMGVSDYSFLGESPIDMVSATKILEGFIESYSSRLHGAPKAEWQVGEWYLFSFGDCQSHSKCLDSIICDLSDKSLNPRSSVLAEWYFGNGNPIGELSPISKAWSQIIREPLIPYDVEQRHKGLAHAFADLAPYVEAHEKEKEMMTRE